VYGLGATLYFLLAGHPPFPTGTVSQKLLWHRTKEPTPIQQIRPEVPDGLAAILARMIAKDPKARYQSPAQVVGELDGWLPPNVPSPPEEEMPHLSIAAMEGAVEPLETSEIEGTAALAATGSGTATKSGAVRATPRPAT